EFRQGNLRQAFNHFGEVGCTTAHAATAGTAAAGRTTFTARSATARSTFTPGRATRTAGARAATGSASGTTGAAVLQTGQHHGHTLRQTLDGRIGIDLDGHRLLGSQVLPDDGIRGCIDRSD